MQSAFESTLASRRDSSVTESVNTFKFPIQRLPDEIISRVIDVGSWANNHFDSTGPDWISDTKPRQKYFVRLASQVCGRWREIAQWQGHPHRWRMCLMLTSEEDGPLGHDDFSRELSRFRRALRASDGCDLLVKMVTWTADPDSDFEFDDAAVVDMQLFMHGIKMLLPYLPQILVVDVQFSQSDPLHLLFGTLQRWTARSRLPSLCISYYGARGGCMRESPSSLSESQLLELPKKDNGDDRLLPSLPPTLVDVYLAFVSLPKSFAFPYGLTHLVVTECLPLTEIHRKAHGNEIDFHSLIPHPTHLTFLHLDLRNTTSPSTEFCLESVLTFRVEIDLKSLLTWSQVLCAKSLRYLHLNVTPTKSDKSLSSVDLSLPSDDDNWLPLLSPIHLNLTCSVNALRGVLGLLAISGLVEMTVELKHRGPITWKMNEYLESLLRIRSMESEELLFPQLQTLTIVTDSEQWCQPLKCASFPKLEMLACIRSHSLPTNAVNEALDLTEWISFSSDHQRMSLIDLVTLRMWLPRFEAGQCHPFEHTPNIEELQVDLQHPFPKDWDMWMMYPGTLSSPHSPPLAKLRTFTLNVNYQVIQLERDISLENDMETKIHAIQASRAQHGVGLEGVRIQWAPTGETTKFRQKVGTGCLERVL